MNRLRLVGTLGLLALALPVFAQAPAPDAGDRDPAVAAWAQTLTQRLADPNPAVRQSVHAAIFALGPAAVPALQQVAGGNDARAEVARNLIACIERGGPMGPRFGGGQGGYGPGQGPAPMGPGGPGGPGMGPQGGPGPGGGFGRGPGAGPMGPGGPGAGPMGPRQPGMGPGGQFPGGPGAGPMAPMARGGFGGGIAFEQGFMAIDVTPEQQARLDAIWKAQQDKTRALFWHAKRGELPPEARGAVLQEQREALLQQLREVLTPAQLEQFQAALQGRGAGGFGPGGDGMPRRGGGAGGPPGQ